MDLPATLHAQLYLLAYDRKRHRFSTEREKLFGFALRSAMLTDLYLKGCIEDRQGKPHAAPGAPSPPDPLLRTMLHTLGDRAWAEVIEVGEQRSRQSVLDQLTDTGWVVKERRRLAGVIPAGRYGLCDESAVSGLADRVSAALRDAIAGRTFCSPGPLALGLLGVLGQLPTVMDFDECSRYRSRLRELTSIAIEPILGLQQAIEHHHSELRSSGACSGG